MKKTLFYGTLAVVLAACTGTASDPAAIAEAFWTSAQEGDLETARTFAIESEGTSLSEQSTSQIESVELGETEFVDDQAHVPTTIAGMQGAPAVVNFATVLVEHEGEWKVDIGATANEMMRSVFGASGEELVQQMGEAIAEGMGEAMQGMAEGLAEGMQAVGEGMAEAMNEAAQNFQARSDLPFEPTQSGTIDPGMREDEVIAEWGEPVERSARERYTYLFYRNGCEMSCGTHDIVILLDGQVIDAVVRHPSHVYSGLSSSPSGRAPAFSPPSEAP